MKIKLILILLTLWTISPITKALSYEHLNLVFSREMLGTDITNFEKVAGTAIYKGENAHFYRVDDCEVMSIIKNNLVVALRLKLTNSCTFDLNQFIKAASGKFPPANTMTFWQFNTLSNVERGFSADCLVWCQKDEEQLVTEFFSGSQQNGGICFMPQVIVKNQAAKAVAAWRDTMIKSEGIDWVAKGQFKSGHRSYVADAINALKHIKPDYLMVGLGEDDPRR